MPLAEDLPASNQGEEHLAELYAIGAQSAEDFTKDSKEMDIAYENGTFNEWWTSYAARELGKFDIT
jgi:hypothetical protein